MGTILVKTALLAVLVVCLPACKQAQLGGGVENATIEIDLLDQPGASYQRLRSGTANEAIGRFGLAKWFSFTDLQKSIWLGAFEVDESLLGGARLYLVTASGGSDSDPDRDGIVNQPGVRVAGSWHAIMPADALLLRGTRVSALTEAAWQRVRDQVGYISDTALRQRLDEFAVAVVRDINGDKQVDYSDVLLWSRSWNATRYRGNISLLDALADAIVAGAPDHVIRAAAESVYRNRPVKPVPPAEVEPVVLGGNVSGDMIITADRGPYLLTRRLTVQGDLHIEANVVIRGQGNLVQVYGDLFVDGLPRQRVVLDQVDMELQSYGSGVTSFIRNADIAGGRIELKIQSVLVEGNTLQSVNLKVSNVVKAAGSLATIRGNTLDAGTVTFQNSGPTIQSFMLRFENNLVTTGVDRLTSLVSRWDANVANLVVRNNTFNNNMLVTRGTPGARLDISSNYWGQNGLAKDTAGVVIPDNLDSSGRPIILYEPTLKSPHPDTPGR
jgi:hypothetical protein